jgi:hypothetical protein
MGYGVEVNILADASRVRSMPDLGPAFEGFAADLMRAAEPA